MFKKLKEESFEQWRIELERKLKYAFNHIKAKTIEGAVAKFGTAPNYSEFEPDGTLKFNGEASTWIDIDFPIFIRSAGLNIPSLTIVQGNITAPQWQVNDFNVCEGQELIHSWEEGTQVSWHAHVITNGTNVNDRFVNWEVEWFWVNVGGQISATDTKTYEMTIPANTPDKTMLIAPIHAWTPTAGKIAAHVFARLRRIASIGTAPTGDPWCTMLQLHVKQDTTGSRLLFIK
jgi:hypothetical protein